MSTDHDSYQSPLTTRYCKDTKIGRIFSDRRRIETWRQLWIWLAEAEFELGLHQISQEAIDEMKSNQKNIDFKFAAAEERKLKHDVMAHNHTFGKVCPRAAGIIHLGATSCYVQDNADLILQKEALQHVLEKIAICLKRLGDFAEKHKKTVTVGRTHYQPASLVTIGKRAAIWLQELLLAFQEIESVYKSLRFRGIKGATGTQDSFMTLFNEDEEKVEKLDELVTAKAGFTRKFFITGQTYTRQQDTKLMFSLSNLGAAMKKVVHDSRMLQSFEEMREPFEADQIGSSAMPYKRNPMKCERIDSLCKLLETKVMDSLIIQSDQGFERTLDDSAARRMLIPESFLLAEACLMTLQNVFEGFTVQHDMIDKVVERELPFLALEEALMRLSDHGVDRQAAHAKIRDTSLAAREQQNQGKRILITDLLKDPFFDPVRDQVIKTASEPINFAGRCVSQVDKFLKEELFPSIQPYLTSESEKRVTLDV